MKVKTEVLGFNLYAHFNYADNVANEHDAKHVITPKISVVVTDQKTYEQAMVQIEVALVDLNMFGEKVSNCPVSKNIITKQISDLIKAKKQLIDYWSDYIVNED